MPLFADKKTDGPGPESPLKEFVKRFNDLKALDKESVPSKLNFNCLLTLNQRGFNVKFSRLFKGNKE